MGSRTTEGQGAGERKETGVGGVGSRTTGGHEGAGERKETTVGSRDDKRTRRSFHLS